MTYRDTIWCCFETRLLLIIFTVTPGTVEVFQCFLKPSQPAMWKQKRKLKAEAPKAVIFYRSGSGKCERNGSGSGSESSKKILEAEAEAEAEAIKITSLV